MRVYVSKHIVIISLLIFSACKTTSTGSPSLKPDVLSFDSTPSGEELIFIGVSGTRSNPKEAVKLALKDAARHVAIFQKVSGKTVSYSDIGKGLFDGPSDTEAVLTEFDQEYEKYVDKLDFNEKKDVFRNETAVFVRTRYKGSLPVSLNYEWQSLDSSKPRWIDNPPRMEDMPGYIPGVGRADRRSYQSDTVKASYNDAIFSIIKTSSVVYNDQLNGNKFDKSKNDYNESIVYANGTLVNFYVLGIWIDPDTKGVYTLAVAKDPYYNK